ncbi:hypothetical protein B0H14DRAFT_3863143 [Mycena olivaceomarginata]|nr:hypothetical protein B0H14DRAFT_3863143 [Mycena olivaceomarginata]
MGAWIKASPYDAIFQPTPDLEMVSKISVVFVAAASLFATVSGSPFRNSTLEGRQTGCIPAAENCDGGKTCCTGLFCSLTAPHTCSKCIPNAEFCTGVPCCSGLFCGTTTATCGPCVPAGRSGCFDHPCCLGSFCGTDGFCH